MPGLLFLDSAPRGQFQAAIEEENVMPFDVGGGTVGAGLNIGVIALLLGLYFVFMKKKNKMIGYGLIGFWAWQSGILNNLLNTGSV
jgi:hypothetical protein